MLDTAFRTYDIRGKVGSEIPIADVYDLGRAIGTYFFKMNAATKAVAIGMDGRVHSEEIKKELSRGLQDTGLDVLFVGVCPSPVLYYALHQLPVQAGVMITASHNPKEYNGFKICLGSECVWGQEIQEIRNIMRTYTFHHAEKKGAYRESLMLDSYVTWLAEHFPHLKGMQLSATIDCGNGAAGTVLPQLLSKMNWKNVSLLYEEVDGDYPHHEADPVVEKNMKDLRDIVIKKGQDLGIGLDGDCDRMAPITDTGFLVPGDQLLSVYAQEMVKKNPDLAVVFDIKSSSGLIELLKKWGARPIMSPSGHSIIKENMKKHHALLSGELSCHFTFKDRHFGFDDGIYAMMRLFEIIVDSEKSLSQLIAGFPKKSSSPEYRIFCPDEKKNAIVAQVTQTFKYRKDAESVTIDGVRVSMPYGWGILRASNTEPALSLRFESDTDQGLSQVKMDFVNAMQDFFEKSVLHQQLNV